MIRKLLIAVLLLAASPLFAADATYHADTPGQTLYVRIITGLTTSVAVPMVEGTAAGVGRYVVTEAALVAAGLTANGTYPFKVFVGAPSTTANDSQVGVGTIIWSGSVVNPARADLRQILGTNVGESTPTRLANNFNAFFTNEDTAISDAYPWIGDIRTSKEAVDTEVAAIKTRTDRIPNIVAGAAGGLFIAGTNSATTVNITGNLSGSVGSVTAPVTADISGSEIVLDQGDLDAIGEASRDKTLAGVLAGYTASGSVGQAMATILEALPDSGDQIAGEDALAGVTQSPVSATDVSNKRTWRVGPDSWTADNIVTVAQNYAGPLGALPDLNEQGDIASVASVSITGAATVTATDLRKSGDGRKAIFDAPALTTKGKYTVIITVATLDDATIPLVCTLIVK